MVALATVVALVLLPVSVVLRKTWKIWPLCSLHLYEYLSTTKRYGGKYIMVSFGDDTYNYSLLIAVDVLTNYNPKNKNNIEIESLYALRVSTVPRC